MTRKSMRIIVGMSLAIVIVAAFTQAWVSAQVDNSQGLEGSWNLVVSLRNCDTGTVEAVFPAMNTYNQGGTMQQTAIPAPGSTGLPGHGVWSHETRRDYSANFQFFALNANPALSQRVIVRSSISLGLGGTSYSSTDTAEILNLNGDLLFRGCSTTAATRFE